MRQALSAFLVLPALAQAAPARPADVQPGPKLPGAMEARPGLFVAGAPGPELLAGLKAAGVTVVLNLRQDAEGDFTAEQRKVEEAGLRYDRCPVGREPDAKMLDAFRARFRSLPKGPGAVLVHCVSGNRVAGALYAVWVLDEGMAPEAALALAKRAGLTNPATEAAVKAYVATRLNL
ncbi:MAG: hypothetical protein IPL96_10180 [Holophagaceae bacterium]|nr:hypothetical protein [Holophagaceae bacterium]